VIVADRAVLVVGSETTLSATAVDAGSVPRHPRRRYALDRPQLVVFAYQPGLLARRIDGASTSGGGDGEGRLPALSEDLPGE